MQRLTADHGRRSRKNREARGGGSKITRFSPFVMVTEFVSICQSVPGPRPAADSKRKPDGKEGQATSKRLLNFLAVNSERLNPTAFRARLKLTSELVVDCW